MYLNWRVEVKVRGGSPCESTHSFCHPTGLDGSPSMHALQWLTCSSSLRWCILVLLKACLQSSFGLCNAHLLTQAMHFIEDVWLVSVVRSGGWGPTWHHLVLHVWYSITATERECTLCKLSLEGATHSLVLLSCCNYWRLILLAQNIDLSLETHWQNLGS